MTTPCPTPQCCEGLQTQVAGMLLSYVQYKYIMTIFKHYDWWQTCCCHMDKIVEIEKKQC